MPDAPKVCDHCGSPLDNAERARLQELQLTAAVAERLSGWVKLFSYFAGVPLVLLLAVGVMLGVSTWTDFTSKIKAASARIDADGTKKIDAALANFQSRVDILNEKIVPVEKRIHEIESTIVLTFQSEGPAVEALQARLQQIGYFHEPVSGKFGTTTIAAVSRLQKDHGLKVDGTAGKDVFQILWPPILNGKK